MHEAGVSGQVHYEPKNVFWEIRYLCDNLEQVPSSDIWKCILKFGDLNDVLEQV